MGGREEDDTSIKTARGGERGRHLELYKNSKGRGKRTTPL
jgi:hypothetical protein